MTVTSKQLLAALSSLFFAGCAYASDDSADIVVRGIVPEDVESVAGSLTIIDPTALARMQPISVKEVLRRVPGVRAVLPRMRFAFPTSGRGGRAIFGRDVGAGEIPADGVDPALVRPDLLEGADFSDPDARSSHRACNPTAVCGEGEVHVTVLLGALTDGLEAGEG
jgi:hypothetical protein